jgi:hypothetical protein
MANPQTAALAAQTSSFFFPHNHGAGQGELAKTHEQARGNGSRRSRGRDKANQSQPSKKRKLRRSTHGQGGLMKKMALKRLAALEAAEHDDDCEDSDVESDGLEEQSPKRPVRASRQISPQDTGLSSRHLPQSEKQSKTFRSLQRGEHPL